MGSISPVRADRVQQRRSAYLGEAGFTSRPYAEDTQRTIDEEVSRLLREAEARATDLLTTHRSALDRVIELLIEREVISGDELLAAIRQTETPATSSFGTGLPS